MRSRAGSGMERPTAVAETSSSGLRHCRLHTRLRRLQDTDTHQKRSQQFKSLHEGKFCSYTVSIVLISVTILHNRLCTHFPTRFFAMENHFLPEKIVVSPTNEKRQHRLNLPFWLVTQTSNPSNTMYAYELPDSVSRSLVISSK